MKACFLGIDIGTGSAKGTIVDLSGTVLAEASISHQMSSPQPGWFEQDADRVWWNDTVYLAQSLVKQLANKSISISSLKGMSVSTTAPCVLPIDKAGKPLRPGIMYGIDTRATKQIAAIEHVVGRDQIFAMTGQHLSSQSACPKIKWIEENEPAVWEKTDSILTSSGYIVFKLTSRRTVDIYDAIGYAPLFNIRERRWDTTYENHLFDLKLLPEMLWTTEVAGTITKQAAHETGLPEGLPVLTGTADAAAEAISCGVSSVGDMMMMYGSSNFFIMQTSALRPVPEFWASNFLVPGTTVLTGGMATVGSLFSWFNETFPGRTFAEWEALARKSKPGANGVTILPYFAGERTPLFDPKAKGAFFGMQLTTTAGDMFQALQEAIGFGIRHNLEVLKQAGEQANRIVAIGGVTSSDMTMQIISDTAECVQQVPSQRLGACYGDAFLAAYGTGAITSLNDIHSWVNIEKEYTPNPKNAVIYDEAYHRYRELYESTKHLTG
jgi:xylulokinase